MAESITILVNFDAAANGQRDRHVVGLCDAGLSERRSMRYVRHEELHRVIWVDSAERVLAEADRQPRAPKRWRIARFVRRGAPPPNITRSLAEGDKHAHRRDGVEHRIRVALRLIERVFLLLRTRVDREARRGRREPVFVLRHWVVERRPHEHLQFCKVLFDDAQYSLVLARGLESVNGTSKRGRV
jgi:hypothetical protein